MSKDKPEVGDIWEDKETHVRIVFIMVSDYYCEYLEHCDIFCEGFNVYKLNNIKSSFWRRDKKYLGKAKASVRDLFKTENEE